MKVPFNYLTFQFKNTKSYFASWKKLIKSTNFTLGPYVKKFENDLAKFVKTDKICKNLQNLQEDYLENL